MKWSVERFSRIQWKTSSRFFVVLDVIRSGKWQGTHNKEENAKSVFWSWDRSTYVATTQRKVKRTTIGAVNKLILSVGSGCGSVGRAVASNTRGPQFESSHQQKFIYILNICFLSTVCWKDENKEKAAGNGPFYKKLFLSLCDTSPGPKMNKNRLSSPTLKILFSVQKMMITKRRL